MFKHILVPVDGSKDIERALDIAAQQANCFNAQVSVVFVVEPLGVSYSPGYSHAELIEETKKWGHEVVDKAAKRLKDTRVDEVQTFVEEGQAGQVIVGKAKEWGVDLIVMGTHGRLAIERLFLGSVSEEVVRFSPIPVLTVRLMEESHT